MFRKSKQLFLIAVPLLLLGSCARIHENLPRCEIYLEFIFDYNMEYVDSFTTHVDAVDVFVFDSNDRFLFSKRAEASELIDGKIMSLADDLELGSYRILTVGALCEHFSFADCDNGDCVRGVTTLEQVQLALTRTSDEVSNEFPHLWFGKVVDIDYSPHVTEHKTWPVYFVRNTNNFNISLVSLDPLTRVMPSDDALYTFEIVTPENAVYSWENKPVGSDTPVMFSAHTLWSDTAIQSLAAGYLNTCRLLDSDHSKASDGDGSGYKFIVRNTKTFKVAWEYDLMTLLANTKPATRPTDGTTLSLQEYLDRQGEWNIAILHRGGGEDELYDGFMAIQVIVNDWIVWENDIEI